MSTELKRIEAETLQLPVVDREQLVGFLLASPDIALDGVEYGPAFATCGWNLRGRKV